MWSNNQIAQKVGFGPVRSSLARLWHIWTSSKVWYTLFGSWNRKTGFFFDKKQNYQKVFFKVTQNRVKKTAKNKWVWMELWLMEVLTLARSWHGQQMFVGKKNFGHFLSLFVTFSHFFAAGPKTDFLGKLINFDQFWSILIRFYEVWSQNLTFGQILSLLINFGHNWSLLVVFCGFQNHSCHGITMVLSRPPIIFVLLLLPPGGRVTWF